MTTSSPVRTGRIAVTCALALMSITGAAACSGGHDRILPAQATPTHSTQGAPAPSSTARSAPIPSATTESAGADDIDEEMDEPLPPGGDFWGERADVAVYLCGLSDPKEGGCHNGAVTNTQREQAAADLRAMPQVEHVYFESQYEAWDLLRRQIPDFDFDSVSPQQLPESFRVKLKDRTTAPVVISAFSGRPGVASAVVQPRVGKPGTRTGVVGAPGSGARS